MIKISFTEKQYRTLLKTMYWADWLKNAMSNVIDEEGKEVQALEQHIYAYSEQFKTTDWVNHEESLNGYFPTGVMEEVLHPAVDKFEDDVFWDELIHRLARRDAIKKHGTENIKGAMDLLTKEEPFIESYAEEFSENGLNNLSLK